MLEGGVARRIKGVLCTMSSAISASGRVCLCEWSGPITVAMVVSLLGFLKSAEAKQRSRLLLIVTMRPSSAASVLKRSTSFVDALPALWAYCQEIAIVCQGEDGLLQQLRRTLCGSVSTPVATLAKPLNFFELLDDAFTHAQGVVPHDVLELRKQRIHSGTWWLTDSKERQCR